MTSTAAHADLVSVRHFCSDQFAEHERLNAWHELLGRRVLRLESEPLPYSPFHFDRTLHGLPGLSMISGRGSGMEFCRPKSMIESDDLSFMIGSAIWFISQFGREATLDRGDAFLNSHGAECAMMVPVWSGITLQVPAAVAPLVPDVHSVVARPIPAATPALQLLVSYLGMLRNGPALTTPGLPRLFATHVHDLMAMALGATRDAREIARGRGVRAALLHTIVEEIKQHFVDPQFSPAAVATKLRVSPRYVQDLLQETGLPFTDRVIALRLEKARTMLESAANSHRKIIDIAYCCGFNDLSYFNRCFRRHFGASPTQFRGTKAAR